MSLLEDIAKKLLCHADGDGECDWEDCPQLRDGEPRKSGRHCPYDNWGEEEL